jgi:ribose/xylose/arabinose/galactoside ABC-type transport system permease subunit
MASYSRAMTGRISSNVLLLALLGLFCLLVFEQVVSGWLVFGERINISRRDYNSIELIVMALGVVWGIFSLGTALRLALKSSHGVRGFFDGESGMPAGVLFSLATLALMGIACAVVAALLLTGWLPLGERTNIPRSNLNWIEWVSIGLTGLWAILCLRTAWGLVLRQRPAWSWAQWLLFLNLVPGIILVLSGIFESSGIVPRGGTLFDRLADIIALQTPGLILLFSSLVAYRYMAAEYGDITAQKTVDGTLSERARARDLRGKRLAAGQMIRIRLAQSPGAGAIIGFLALFTFFSVATDLFLQPGSLAGALTNNVTRGIVAVGATMLMISGEFDLSVGSLLGIGGLTFLGLLTGEFPPGSPQFDPLSAAVITLVFVGFLGWLNGMIVIRTGIPSFIVTLGTMLMLRAIPLVFIAGGRNIRYVDYFRQPPEVEISRVLVAGLAGLALVVLLFFGRLLLRARFKAFQSRRQGYDTADSDFRTLALLGSGLLFVFTLVLVATLVVSLLGVAVDQTTQFTQGSAFLHISFFDLMNGRITSLPIIGPLSGEVNLRIGVFWWFLLVLTFQFFLNQTPYGNATFATGGNIGAARAQGINVNGVKVRNFILIAVLAGIAGIFDASRLQSVDALRGQGLELEVIAATVIGGALLTGGYGSIIGALLGVFIFGMMQTGLVLIGVDARMFDAFIGAIILGAVIINTWSRRVAT